MFNGQEKVNEIAGIGNHNTALFWEYDTRLGRRWNVDPVFKEWRSPYDAFNNNPIFRIDFNGDDDATVINEKGDVVGGTIDGDKGVYQVSGVTKESFCVGQMNEYKTKGKKVGETISEYSFKEPESGEWMGKVNFNSEAKENLSKATKLFGNHMKNNSLYSSLKHYISQGGNGGDYDIKSWGIENWHNTNKQERLNHVYQASFSSENIIMTRRDQGNFFAGRASKMLGLPKSVMHSGFGAFQSNNNTLNFKFLGKAAINVIDISIMNAAFSGTPAEEVNIRPIFSDDLVSEELQTAGYEQFD